MKNTKKLEATAYHEAGHAVASYFLQRPFRFVTINPGDDFLGRVVGRVSDVRYRLKMAERGFISTREAVISAAGPEAERKYRGRRNHHGADKDYQQIVDIARGVGEDGCGGDGNNPMAQAIIGASFKEARFLLDSRWPMVERVAHELLRRETLTQDEVVSILMKKAKKTAEASK
jgi:ATP-dependent Zn protease